MKDVLSVTCVVLLVTLGAAEPTELSGSEGGPDLTSCTGTAADETKEAMRLYRQCLLRANRNVGKFKAMSDDVFDDMVSEASSDALIDDLCYDKDQAIDLQQKCEQNEAQPSDDRPRVKRAISSFARRWPTDSPIPFTFRPECNFDTDAMNLIRSVLTFFEDNTCLSFEERGSDEPNDGIVFTCEDGCFSYIGNVTSFVPQQVNLNIGSAQEGTCLTFPIIAHEVMHALGVRHEQSRSDRNDHVIIFIQNVRENRTHNFNIDEFSIQYTPYDYTSVMHYGKKDFLGDGDYTILAQDPNRDTSLGQRGEVSFRDLLGLNLHYCEVCSDDPCLYGGYLAPDDCEVCICTPVFDTPDDDCDDIPALVNAACSGSEQVRTLTTDGETTTVEVDFHIVNVFTCAWRIIGVAGMRLRVDTSAFDLHIRSSENLCRYEWLEIYIEADAMTMFSPSRRWCGATGPDRERYDTDRLIILFRATRFPAIFGVLTSNGFTLIITLEEIPTTTTTATTTTTTPTTTTTTPTTTTTTPTTTTTTPTTTTTTPTTTTTTPTTTTTTPTSTTTTPTTTTTTPTTTTTTPTTTTTTPTTTTTTPTTTTTTPTTTTTAPTTTTTTMATTTTSTEVAFEVRLFVIVFFGAPPTPPFFNAFFQFWEDVLTFFFNLFCPNNCPAGFNCAGVSVQQFAQLLFRNNVVAIYVVRIQITISCVVSPASDVPAANLDPAMATSTDVQLPANVIRDFLLANFNNLTRSVTTCCSAGVIPACCNVNVSSSVTIGPVNGTVQIPPEFTTTTTTTTTRSTTRSTTTPAFTIRPVQPAPTRQSYIAAIWGGVGAAVLFVIILVVVMLLGTGACNRFRRTALPSLNKSPINKGMILRRADNWYKPGLHQVVNPMSPYYS